MNCSPLSNSFLSSFFEKYYFQRLIHSVQFKFIIDVVCVSRGMIYSQRYTILYPKRRSNRPSCKLPRTRTSRKDIRLKTSTSFGPTANCPRCLCGAIKRRKRTRNALDGTTNRPLDRSAVAGVVHAIWRDHRARREVSKVCTITVTLLVSRSVRVELCTYTMRVHVV